MRSHAVTFTGASGETLSARLDVPADGEPIACALFAHCFTCSKNLNAVVNVSRALTQERIAVLRSDFTGLGESAGEFAATGFSSKRRRWSPMGLGGHTGHAASPVPHSRSRPGMHTIPAPATHHPNYASDDLDSHHR